MHDHIIVKRQYFGNTLKEEVVGRDLWTKEDAVRRAHMLSGASHRIGYEARPADAEQLASFGPLSFCKETKRWVPA